MAWGVKVRWQEIWNEDDKAGGNSLLKVLAAFLSFFYLGGVFFRNWLYDRGILKAVKLPCPVISIGNLSVGGTGKTPCTMMIARLLQNNGFRPAVLSRGYGGLRKGPYQVVSDGSQIFLEAKAAGDEPFLMAQELNGVPILIGSKRKISGQAAIEKYGADVLLCDDAMQHRQLHRDVNLVLMDDGSAGGHDHVLPRGRWREPVTSLKRADAVLLTGTDEGFPNFSKIEALVRPYGLPVFRCIRQPRDILRGDKSASWPVSVLKGKKIFAFCGIARPESFQKMLRALQGRLVAVEVFADHHWYGNEDIARLRKKFADSGAEYLVTTQKDAVRLQDQRDFLKMISVLRIDMDVRPVQESFERFLLDKIRRRGNQREL